MKKLMFIFTMLVFLPLTSHAEQPLKNNEAFIVAKAVKLGRGNAYSTVGLNSLRPETSLAKDCDPNCLSCDETTGVCSKCKSDRYLKNNLCMVCPDNAVCYGDSSFSCNDEYYQSSNQCISICTGVRCVSGTTATPTNNRCCCL